MAHPAFTAQLDEPAVIEICFHDPTIGSRFAIQLANGTYWGQKWKNRCRTYPTWKTRRGAERKLKWLIDNGVIT